MSQNDHNIAVIGMACRFPGANTLDQFWNNLVNGKETIKHFMRTGLSKQVDRSLLSDKNYVMARGVLEYVDQFDASFFNYSKYEASATDPQHRMFIEAAWEAIEKAGLLSNKSKKRVGVFTGASGSSYLQNYLLKNSEFLSSHDEYQTIINNSPTFLASKISYLFNLHGPSVAINTACSTSLATIIYACKSLLSNDCDAAIAGGVTLELPQEKGYLYREGAIFSPDGHCRAFDEMARGVVTSNGLGVVVLKKIADAERDKDVICAVIKGFCVNNDGNRKAGYAAPSIDGQADCICAAIKHANIDPETIGYIEAHGTGTALGDPIEINALTKAFHYFTKKKSFCAIGSVKTNIGHTDNAAGVAGFIKTVLSLQHKQIVPSLHYNKENSQINFNKTPFYVSSKASRWKSYNKSYRRAGVSSFGIGGTNTHVILEEYIAQDRTNNNKKAPNVLLISAKTKAALEKNVSNLSLSLSFLLHDKPRYSIADVAFTLQNRRQHFNFRTTVVCESIENAVHILSDKHKKIVQLPCGYTATTIFMFPGQGMQYSKMGYGFYVANNTFRGAVDECCLILEKIMRIDLRNILFSNNSDLINNTQYAQPLLFVIEYALAKMFFSFGIVPDAMIGSSIGEYVVAHLAGLFSLNDALMLVAARGEFISELEEGAMLSVSLNVRSIKQYLNDDLSIAAINAKDFCVLSGTKESICAVNKVICSNEKNVVTKVLKTSHAFHSKMLRPIVNKFKIILGRVVFFPAKMPIVSTVTGKMLSPTDMTDTNYWIKHLLQPVLFYDGILSLLELEGNIFIEIGPGTSLSTFVLNSVNPASCYTISTITKTNEINGKSNKGKIIHEILSRLWACGRDIEWEKIYDQRNCRLVPLPTYPFKKEKHWVEPDSSFKEKLRGFLIPTWQSEIVCADIESKVAENNSWLIFEDKYGLGKKLADVLENRNQTVISVKAGNNFMQISEHQYMLNHISREDFVKLSRALSAVNIKPDNVLYLSAIDDKNVSSLNHTCLEKGVTEFFTLIYIAQTLFNQTDNVNLTVVANNTKSVSQNEVINPLKSTLLGLLLVIPQEYPRVKARVIDIQIDEMFNNKASLIDTIFKEAIKNISEPVLAIRKNSVWVEAYKAASCVEVEKKQIVLRDGGLYIISGGLGNMGLVLASSIAKQVTAKIVLLNRSSFPAKENWIKLIYNNCSIDATLLEKIKKVVAIEKLGSEIIVLKTDVSNYEVLERSLKAIKNVYGNIHGIIHAAGLVGMKSKIAIKDLDSVSVCDQFKPKILGAINLSNLTSDDNLDFFIACSSISSILGGVGYAAYASTNSFLDALAHQFCKKQYYSICWDAWDFSKDFPNSTNHISPESGEKIFQDALGYSGVARLIYANSDLHSRLKRYINPAIPFFPGKFNDIADKKDGGKSNVESIIIAGFKSCLGVEYASVDDDFYALGGNSLLSIRLLAMISDYTGVKLNQNDLQSHGTVSKLKNLVDQRKKCVGRDTVVILQPKGEKSPLFLMHPINGEVDRYTALSKKLTIDRPIICLQDPTKSLEGVLFKSIEDMAANYINEILKNQSSGSYLIGGYSFGATLAVEIAKQLNMRGKKIALLALFDGWALFSEKLKNREHFKESMLKKIKTINDAQITDSNAINEYIGLMWRRMQMLTRYNLSKITEVVHLFKAKEILAEYANVDDVFNHWSKYADQIVLHSVPGNHETMFDISNISILSKQLQNCLNKINN